MNRQRLEEEDEILTGRLASLQIAAREGSPTGLERPKGDDEIADRDLSESLRTARIQQLIAERHVVREILTRMNDKDYGKCRGCRKEISDARMEATKGTAVRCKDCQDKQAVGGTTKVLYGTNANVYSRRNTG